MKGWRTEGSRARVWRALAEAGDAGLDNAELMACGLDLGRKALAVTLNQIKALGFIRLVADGSKPNRWQVVRGRTPTINDLAGDDSSPGAGALDSRLTLAAVLAQVGAHLCKCDRGSDSGTLAAMLGCTVDQVDQALAPAVAAGRLMTCRVQRADGAVTHYRVSSKGVARYNWRVQAGATWDNARAQAAGAQA